MKTGLAISSVLVILIAVSWMGGVSCQEFECESWGNGTCVEEIFPYPYDCSQYVQCTAGCQALIRDCPPGLEFSPTELECLNPEVANCEVTTTVAPNTTTTPLTTTVEPPDTTTIGLTTGPSTTPGETTTTPLANPSIFFVARETSFTTGGEVDFTFELTDRHGDVDTDGNDRFVAPTNGLYFFNLNAGIHPDDSGNYRLQFPNTTRLRVNAKRTSNAHNGIDASSRDIIHPLTAGDELFMVCVSASGLYSDQYLQTSWGGFSIHDSMEFVSAFSAGNINPYDTLGPVTFEEVLVGNDFDGTTYIAPRDGLYFFSLSVGVTTGYDPVTVELTVNGAASLKVLRDHSSQNNQDTFSRSELLELSAGDTVEYNLVAGSLFSTERLLTSFTGFHVKPRFSNAVGWFASRTTSWESSGANLSPVDYDEVLVNVGGAFDEANSQVLIQQSGFYYIHFGAGAPGSSSDNGGVVNLRLEVNGSAVVDLHREATNYDGLDTMSRGIMLQLLRDEVVIVSAQSGSGFYGHEASRLTYFLGMLLYSTE